ncbi:MAG: cytochrome-c oxidase, cbb3-type subunit I [Gammaproteobacteria bacterium]|nr:cytochrome-c oxidase, cbb3-type subunit I [Gammaproteobacteria bacterium]MCY4344323.1 cytochrome-c oxidase, cbb3-type subunit I [Gammaproteobacteria bacterium]
MEAVSPSPSDAPPLPKPTGGKAVAADRAAGGTAGERYHDRVASWLTAFAMAWSIIGMTAGVYVAAELVWPTIDFGREWLSYGRLRTLHTNAVIFGFGVSALMGTAFYSVQRTCHVPLFAPRLAWFCALAWQAGVLAGGISLLAGWNGGKEYAELEWPFDIAITVVWVCFAIVFFGTIAKRRIKPIYVSNWFYGGLIIVIAMLHLVNSLAIPVTLSKSYSLFAGAQDAIVQWWYGHNAVGFLLTGGFLGMLYYFLPKHAGRPIWSYRLSIVAFWAFTYSYIWAGPHHLHYNAVPEWVQSLGMVMSLVLLAPSWATLVNGVMTVAGAWEKLRTDPALKFIVLSLAFYGLATFEGPMMSIRSVNVVSHFTDWTIGHVHSGALGWNAMITFGAFYFLVPRLMGASLHSVRLANIHFWLALAGTMLYILAMWGAGVSQGLLWLSLDDIGELSFSFKDIMASMAPYYALRLVAGLIFLSGALLMAYNLAMTGKGRRTVAASPPATAAA